MTTARQINREAFYEANADVAFRKQEMMIAKAIAERASETCPYELAEPEHLAQRTADAIWELLDEDEREAANCDYITLLTASELQERIVSGVRLPAQALVGVQ